MVRSREGAPRHGSTAEGGRARVDAHPHTTAQQQPHRRPHHPPAPQPPAPAMAQQNYLFAQGFDVASDTVTNDGEVSAHSLPRARSHTTAAIGGLLACLLTAPLAAPRSTSPPSTSTRTRPSLPRAAASSPRRRLQPPGQQRRQEPLGPLAVPLEGDLQVQRRGRHGVFKSHSLRGGEYPRVQRACSARAFC